MIPMPEPKEIERLIRQASRRITSLPGCMDRDDLMQIGQLAYFTAHKAGKFSNIENVVHLHSMIQRCILFDIIDELRQMRGGRGVNAPLFVSAEEGESFILQQVAVDNPERQAQVGQAIRGIERRGSKTMVLIVPLLLEGFNFREIAKKVGCSERWISRITKDMQRIVMRVL